MAGNLKDRLRRIHDAKNHGGKPPEALPKEPAGKEAQGVLPGWEEAGFQTLRRKMSLPAPADLPQSLSAAASIVVPDINRIAIRRGSLPEITDLLFFDLETTGLSGGAGTLAFLAAFGRFVPTSGRGGFELHITQYLLLDFPGEKHFLNAVTAEFEKPHPTLVTYNGKCFDWQILRNRCIVINRAEPPPCDHADLLYPARRLWKRVASNCSQGTIETEVLGIDRSGDTPGYMAPQIWLDFLNNGRPDALLGICDHNKRDIAGLAAVFASMADLAMRLFAGTPAKHIFDTEKLALHWRDFARRFQNEPLYAGQMPALEKAGSVLLRLAAGEKHHSKAAFFYALDQMQCGDHDDGKKRMLEIAASCGGWGAAAFRALAIDSEKHRRDIPAALDFAKKGLAAAAGGVLQEDFQRRVRRLEEKLGTLL
ncbi:MAG: ribonuclease H-like domain-containing protein [Spirochaetes bacterium]|nr:ribonuclease H-like domain-containing protein [Spirochaetota bacterium]